MKIIRINFALIFDKEVSDSLIKTSQKIANSNNSNYILSKQSIPHISVAQVDVKEDKVNELLDFNKDFKCIVKTCGLNIRQTDKNKTWLEISVLKNKKLKNLQSDVLEVIGNKKVINGVGDNYRPHITLGLLQNNTFNLDFQNELFVDKEITSYLKVGYVGENGILKNLLN